MFETLKPYVKRYWKIIALSLVLAAINQVFSLLDPYIFRLILDGYVTKYGSFTQHAFFVGVTKLTLLGVLTTMVSRFAKNFQDYFVNRATLKIGADMYTDGLKHSLELPYQVFEDQRSGETLGILQRVRTDVEKLIQSFVNVVFMTLVGFTFVLVYAFSVTWIVAVLFLVSVPTIGFAISLLSRKVKTVQTKIVAQTTALAGSTTESLRNIELVKSLGLSQQEIARLNGTTAQILELELEKVKYIRSLSFIQGTIVDTLRRIMLFVMLSLVFFQVITFGEFFSLYFYSFFLFGPLAELGNTITAYREAEASVKNFKEIMAAQKEAIPEHPTAPGKLEKVEFSDVSYRHAAGTRNALTDVSFEAGIGKTIAFVGPSGAGKSTLVKLLVGLYTPASGTVSYNNIPSTKVSLDDLRRQIGFVTQDTQLFAGTIRENLQFVKPNATDAELTEVLGKAAAKSLLERADAGLDTKIGEGGMKVSGGEKQRLSIARALLREPRILVFDEATSSLDSLTEEEITKTIRELSAKAQHITILIAHRLSTVMHADKIFVLEKGAVSESGSHEELLATKGLYYAMWRQQIGEENK